MRIVLEWVVGRGVNEVLAVGAAFGTSKAGIGIAGLGTFKPELIMKVRVPLCALAPLLTATQSLIPVVMSGIIAVYGLVVSVLIAGNCMRLPPASLPLLTCAQ